MKKTFTLLLQAWLAAALPVAAQVESPNTATTLDATWTEIHEPSAQSDGDLHLAGRSTVDFTITDKTVINSGGYYSYKTTVEIRNSQGTTKVRKYYQVSYSYGTIKWQESTDGTTYSTIGSGSSVLSSLSINNGETGDVIYMRIYDTHGSGRKEVVLTTLTSTSTRYDLYDNLPLFGSDTGSTPTSNRIQDHNQIIDVYVHRTIIGDGAWGTLCLPFDMSDAQVRKSLGDNVIYSEFEGVDLDRKHINFRSTSNGMKAGKPYLIRNNGKTIDNFFADDVTFTRLSVEAARSNRKSTVESNGYYLVGLLEPTKVNKDEPTFNPNGRSVYIANPSQSDSEQQLKRLSADGTIKAFRAYLVFPEETSTGAKPAINMAINLDDMLNSLTSVSHVHVDGKPVSNRIYNLRGQYVGNDASSLPHGIYIRNGKKFTKE